MKDTAYKKLKLPFEILASKALLLWLAGGWLMYYVSLAIWEDEAFALFVEGVRYNMFVQGLFFLFLINGYLNIFRAVKNKFSGSKTGFIAWLMLSAGLMLYFTGFFLSINLRQFDSRLVGNGDLVRLPWTSESYRVTDVKPGIRDHYRQTDPGGILEHEPKITVMDSHSQSYEVGAYPPVRIGGTYFHILNYGIAPGVELFEEGVMARSGYMALRLLPPGRSDYFDIEPYPYRFLVSLAPEHTDQNAHHPEPAFNLKKPVYSTRVFSGEKVIAEGDSGDPLSFDRFAIRYFQHKHWVQLESAKDPGAPLMRLGIFLFIFGLPVYIFRMVLSFAAFVYRG